MAYDDKYNKFRGNSGKGQKQEEKKVINEPLSVKYADKKSVFLEGGVAFNLAKNMRDIPPHQLRKILSTIKNAALKVKKDPKEFNTARDELFYVVPLTAYNAGRNKNIKPLYYFVQEHITEKTIRSAEDIKVLDELFTSVIAYHKFNNAK